MRPRGEFEIFQGPKAKKLSTQHLEMIIRAILQKQEVNFELKAIPGGKPSQQIIAKIKASDDEDLVFNLTEILLTEPDYEHMTIFQYSPGDETEPTLQKSEKEEKILAKAMLDEYIRLVTRDSKPDTIFSFQSIHRLFPAFPKKAPKNDYAFLHLAHRLAIHLWTADDDYMAITTGNNQALFVVVQKLLRSKTLTTQEMEMLPLALSTLGVLIGALSHPKMHEMGHLFKTDMIRLEGHEADQDKATSYNQSEVMKVAGFTASAYLPDGKIEGIDSFENQPVISLLEQAYAPDISMYSVFPDEKEILIFPKQMVVVDSQKKGEVLIKNKPEQRKIDSIAFVESVGSPDKPLPHTMKNKQYEEKNSELFFSSRKKIKKKPHSPSASSLSPMTKKK